MKIRTGFVANSSSSNFIVMYEELNFNDVRNRMKKEDNIFVLGKYLSEGRDYFLLTKDILKYLIKHPQIIEINGFVFAKEILSSEDRMEITNEIPKNKKVIIEGFMIDYHISEDLETFKGNYCLEE